MLYIFDMGGVVTTTARIEERMCSLLGITEAEFKDFCSNGDGKGKNLFDMCSDGDIDTKTFWKMFSAKSGIDVKTDWWHWLFHPVLNEKTVQIIRKLKSEGHRVVCGTNTISAHYFNHLERGDYAYFDQTYTSCAMGFSKPDPEFWKIILTAEEFRAEDAVFIDDKAENCEAAQKLGIRAIQFSTAEEVAAALGVKL